MKQTKYIYKTAKSIEELEEILNKENTGLQLATIIELHEIFFAYLIVWES